MPSDPTETIKVALSPHIKPREQIAYVRRVLALHLDFCRGQSPITRPPSLASSSEAERNSQVPIPSIQRDYLRALRANAEALARYGKARHTDMAAFESRQEHEAGAGRAGKGIDYLELHAAVLELRQKVQRLEIIQKHMDGLFQMPATTPDYLSPNAIFADCTPLPAVPPSIVDFLAFDSQPPKADDIRALASRLEKAALRAKLLLKQEKRLLVGVKAKPATLSESVSNSAKLRALSASRDELIGWIETKLGKTSEDEELDGKGDKTQGRANEKMQEIDASKNAMMDMLEVVKKTYGRYVASRRSLLAATSLRPQVPIIAIQRGGSPTFGEASSLPTPATFLLTPYLEKLLAVSRNQKDFILQKSHLNSTFAKQARDICQMLDHLADESQLLPQHASSANSRGIGDDINSLAEQADISGRIRPWVMAADTAKLSTLEVVAEKIEEGQVALEGSMEALKEIEHLLGWRLEMAGQDFTEAKQETLENNEDVRHETDAGSKSRIPKASRAAAAKKGREEESKGLWSLIDGKLGLIGSEDTLGQNEEGRREGM